MTSGPVSSQPTSSQSADGRAVRYQPTNGQPSNGEPEDSGDTIVVRFNGQPTTMAAARTVGSLVDELVCERRGTAVAMNEEVVPRSQWDATVVTDGARIDVLTAARGG